MYSDIKNKVVLVTGSTQGIGKSVALSFLKNDTHVVINGKNKKRLDKALKDIGGGCFGVVADVSDERQVKDMVKKIVKKFGKIDILVNNAGEKTKGKIEEVSQNDWQRVLDVNLWGVFLCCQEVVSVMKKNTKSRIINISSDAGRVGCSLISDSKSALPAFALPYGISKGGVISLTKYLAKELASLKINVNVICPGIIETEFISQMTVNKFVKNKIPLNKLGQSEDIADLALFLSSDKSKYITGQTFSINGGMHMNF